MRDMDDLKFSLPHSWLIPYIKYYWSLEADYVSAATERVIPFGNVQLCFYRGNVTCETNRLDSKSLLCGQTTRFTDVMTEGKIRIVAVVFQPFGAKAFFSMPMDTVVGLKVRAEELGDPGLKELEERIAGTDDVSRCIGLLDDFFLRRMLPLKDYNCRRMEAVIGTIRANGGNVPVPVLAEASMLSRKQFLRVFREYVGINPKEYLRTVRMQYAMSLMQNGRVDNFTRLACDCGFYDQAHLISEFRSFTGYTPKEYLSVCAPYSDYFE